MLNAKSQANTMESLLLDLEAALRGAQLWQQQAPSAEALASNEPFCVDTLSFAQWLQFVFIPRIQFMLEHCAPLPSISAIAAMGEEAFKGQGDKLFVIAPVLNNIDHCLAQGSRQVQR